ncbi:MAG: branched-chain amino acid ABC transporter permease [Thermodesulfobacteriota bacterium]
MSHNRIWNVLLFSGLFVLLAVLPKLVSEFRLSLVITMLIYSLVAIGFNMLFGQGGLLSFGHAAYFGIGAYTAILVYKHFGFSLLPGILAGGICGALLGILFGFFLARLRGLPFALLSLAFNALIYASAEKWRPLTGGEDGLAIKRPNLSIPGLGSLDMFPTVNFYYFVVIIVVLCVMYCWFFTKTPLGRLDKCMRENEERTGFIGYNTYATKFLVYVIAAFFCSTAGALASSFQEFVSTAIINLDKSGEILFLAFVGGRGIFWGPILGACFLTYLNDALSTLTEHWAIIQGAIFIALVIYAPDGLAGLILQTKNWLFGRVNIKKG